MHDGNGEIDVNAQFGGLEARQKLEKKLLRKLDARMSVLLLIYILNYVSFPLATSCAMLTDVSFPDRPKQCEVRWSSLAIFPCLTLCYSAARLKGFEEDLHLQGEQFATLLSILYVGYILMQVPSYVPILIYRDYRLISKHSNMFLNKIGKPSVYIPCCILIWGMISCLTGVTKNFVGALLTRFFLGFVEAAFLPGSLFLISKVCPWLVVPGYALTFLTVVQARRDRSS